MWHRCERTLTESPLDPAGGSANWFVASSQMSYQDWVFSIHLLFAATLVGGLFMSWILVAALWTAPDPEATLSLILSMHNSEQFLFEALKAGASGYVLKSGADTDIVDACRAAIRGDSYLYPSAVATLVRDYVERGGHGEEEFDVLTPRELEVLKLIAEAQASKQISEALFISVKTVDRHRQNILDKLGMRDRVELTRYAIHRGLIQP